MLKNPGKLEIWFNLIFNSLKNLWKFSSIQSWQRTSGLKWICSPSEPSNHLGDLSNNWIKSKVDLQVSIYLGLQNLSSKHNMINERFSSKNRFIEITNFSESSFHRFSSFFWFLFIVLFNIVCFGLVYTKNLVQIQGKILVLNIFAWKLFPNILCVLKFDNIFRNLLVKSMSTTVLRM